MYTYYNNVYTYVCTPCVCVCVYTYTHMCCVGVREAADKCDDTTPKDRTDPSALTSRGNPFQITTIQCAHTHTCVHNVYTSHTHTCTHIACVCMYIVISNQTR